MKKTSLFCLTVQRFICLSWWETAGHITTREINEMCLSVPFLHSLQHLPHFARPQTFNTSRSFLLFTTIVHFQWEDTRTLQHVCAGERTASWSTFALSFYLHMGPRFNLSLSGLCGKHLTHWGSVPEWTPVLTLVLSWEHWRRCFFTEILQVYVQLSSARCQLTNLPLLVYADYSGGHRTPKAEWGWTSPKTSSASVLPQTTPHHCHVLVTMKNYIRRCTDISQTFS